MELPTTEALPARFRSAAPRVLQRVGAVPALPHAAVVARGLSPVGAHARCSPMTSAAAASAAPGAQQPEPPAATYLQRQAERPWRTASSAARPHPGARRSAPAYSLNAAARILRPLAYRDARQRAAAHNAGTARGAREPLLEVHVRGAVSPRRCLAADAVNGGATMLERAAQAGLYRSLV